MNVGQEARERSLMGRIDLCRREFPRSEIRLWTQTQGKRAAVDGQSRHDDGFEYRLVPESACPQRFDVFRAHRRSVAAYFATKLQQRKLWRREVRVLGVVQEAIDLTIRDAKGRKDLTVQGHAIGVMSVSCNA